MANLVPECSYQGKEVLSLAQKQSGSKEVTLLSDTHVTTAYGHQEQVEIGYNPKKHGRPSFQPKVAFLHDTGWLINFQLCGGKSHSKTDFQTLYVTNFICNVSSFNETESLPPDACWLSRVRLDKGFFSEETCLFLESKETITYYLKTIVNPRMQSYFTSIREEHFIHVDGTPSIRLASLPACPLASLKAIPSRQKNTQQRALLELPQPYQYEAIVTNADGETPEEIFRSYNSVR